MEYFNKSKAIKLRSHLGKYLVADEENTNLRQSRNGTTKKSLWLIEIDKTKPNLVRLRSHHGRYLTATDTPFLLGMTGNKVVQADYDAGLSWKYEWEPIKEGMSSVKLKSWCGKFLRGNGGTPPWRNSVTHDDPSSATYNWILWGVEFVELSLHNNQNNELFNQTSFASNSSFDSCEDVHDSQSVSTTSINKTWSLSKTRHNSKLQVRFNHVY
ncbi:hypothetical protein L195_g043558 [Trifolium pratense]|uniref:DUF569 domain-containing protein n=1 Tax=Trifolium pratense TaxID=57577 RepID=A0A2K3M9L8_TRIPR|nr:hypothetical protein L195_g042482 [Trifolium pratense]PNX87469.1 hypothetical protein L195_g043558 [Trifolium pratense]